MSYLKGLYEILCLYLHMWDMDLSYQRSILYVHKELKIEQEQNFCTGTQFSKTIAVAKVDARAAPLKKSTVFFLACP